MARRLGRGFPARPLLRRVTPQGATDLDVSPSAISIAGTLTPTGDIQIGVGFDLAASSLAITGALTASGDIQSAVDPTLDVSSSALSVSGALTAAGDIQIGTSFDLAASTLALTGIADVTGDVSSSDAAVSGRRVRRSRTKFLPPAADPEQQEKPAEKTEGLVSEEAMTLLIQDKAGKAIRKARVSATKRRIEIASHNVKALESTLMEWF